MIVAWLAALALLAQEPQPTPVPPPVAQETAECELPTYASDQLVCGDEALKALDTRLAGAVQPPVTAFIESPADWFRRSRLCAFRATHRECLVAAYEERLALVEAAFGEAAPVQTLICDGVWRKRGLTLGPVVAGQVVQLRENGTLLVLASPAPTPGAAWTPFMRWTGAGDRISFQPLTGRAIACRIARASTRPPFRCMTAGAGLLHEDHGGGRRSRKGFRRRVCKDVSSSAPQRPPQSCWARALPWPSRWPSSG
ncbi:MAG: hypothetical protein KA105_09645 [Caulobacter sp.]|nr:hypothetical protein [Caulobacter sp.]